MPAEWKLEEADKDDFDRPTGPVRRAFEAWARKNRLQINRVRPQHGKLRPEYPYISNATRAAWRAWQGAIAAVAAEAADSLRVALAMAVLKGDEAAAGALVDLLLESGVGTGRKGG